MKSYIKNTPIWIRFSHSQLYQRVRNYSYFKKQKEELKFYQELLKGLDVNLIFDIGANVGQKSYLFSKIAKQVLAFEPSRECFYILKSRFKNSNITVLNLALGNQKGLIEFYEISNNEAYNSLSLKHIDTIVKSRNITSPDEIKMMITPIDTVEHYINEYGKPEFIKIDVEGFEWEVIKGLKSNISLISFEINLPEFIDESVKCIEYLARMSGFEYGFRFAVDTQFISEYLSWEDAISFLKTVNLRYLEVYAKLLTDDI